MNTPKRLVTVLAILTLMVGVAGAVGITAASATTKALPTACKTFTVKSADQLFGISTSKKPTEKSVTAGSGESAGSECTVKYGSKTLIVETSRLSGGFGGPLVCYKKTALGSAGKVCVPTISSYHYSIALFTRSGVDVSDSYNRSVPNKGAALYTFALAQYKKV